MWVFGQSIALWNKWSTFSITQLNTKSTICIFYTKSLWIYDIIVRIYDFTNQILNYKRFAQQNDSNS